MVNDADGLNMILLVTCFLVNCWTNLSGYTDGSESVCPACEEPSPTDQQNPDVVLTFLLQTKTHDPVLLFHDN